MTSTTDPQLRSFLEIPADSHFPIQNLPYGVFRRSDGEVHIGVAIGEHILDLTVLEEKGVLTSTQRAFSSSTLNAFMSMGRSVWSAVRAQVSGLLTQEDATLRSDPELHSTALVAQADVHMLMPVHIGDYTDFYSSREHATNVGTMLRGPDDALQPNWLHLPVAYHGRSSSVVLSGTPIHRPQGQRKPANAEVPTFGPTKALDFELEMGVLVGTGNELGSPIALADAWEHLFGMVLVNDWSARDIQGWEYIPLGPFLSKSFATSISPWVVPMEALEPFRCPGPSQDPKPLPYLQEADPRNIDVALEVHLRTADSASPVRISASNFQYMYWSVAQQLAHHTVNGCNLQPGDLLASGTISGPSEDSRGCLLELAWRGSKPLELPGGETRSFLHDGDTLTLTGWCQGDGYRVGFGECTGKIEGVRG